MKRRIFACFMAFLLAFIQVLSGMGEMKGVKAVYVRDDDFSMAQYDARIYRTVNVSIDPDRNIPDNTFYFDEQYSCLWYSPTFVVPDDISDLVEKGDDGTVNCYVSEYPARLDYNFDNEKVVNNLSEDDLNKENAYKLATERDTAFGIYVKIVDGVYAGKYLLQQVVRADNISREISVAGKSVNLPKSTAITLYGYVGGEKKVISQDDDVNAVVVTSDKPVTGVPSNDKRVDSEVALIKYHCEALPEDGEVTSAVDIPYDEWQDSLKDALSCIEGKPTGKTYVIYAGFFPQNMFDERSLYNDYPGVKHQYAADVDPKVPLGYRNIIKLTAYNDETPPVVSTPSFSVGGTSTGGTAADGQDTADDNQSAAEGIYYVDINSSETTTVTVSTNVDDANMDGGSVSCNVIKNGEVIGNFGLSKSTEKDNSLDAGDPYTGTYDVDVSDFDDTDVLEFQIVATDLLGNETELEKSDYKIMSYDSTKSETNVTWSSGNTSGGTTDGESGGTTGGESGETSGGESDGTSGGTSDNSQSGNPTLEVSGTYATEPTKIIVSYKKDGEDAEPIEQSVNAEKDGAYYTIDELVELSIDSPDNAQLSDFKITVCNGDDELSTYGDSADENLGEVDYDNTKPVITYDDAYTKTAQYLYTNDAENPNWINAQTTADNLIVDAQNKKVKVENINFSSGDSMVYESDLAEVSVTPDTGSVVCSPELSTNVKKTTGTLTLPESDSLGGTKFTWTVKDASGNLADENINGVMYIDFTPPVIKGINIAEKSYSPETKIYASETTQIIPDVTDNAAGVATVQYYVDGKYVKLNTGSSALAGVSPVDDLGFTKDGEYQIKLVVTDNAGNYSEKSFNVEYDNAPPDVDVTLVGSDDDGATWSPVTVSKGDVYYIDKNHDKRRYAYEVTASDKNIGTADVVKVKLAEVLKAGEDIVTAEDGMYICRYEIDSTKLDDKNAFNITVTAADILGNTSVEKLGNLSVCAVNTDFSIRVDALKQGENVIPQSEYGKLAYGTNKSHTIVAAAEGSNELSYIKLVDKDGNVIAAKEDFSDSVYDEVTKRYTTTAEFVIPGKIDGETVKYSELNLEAEDTDGSIKTAPVLTMLYDSSNPTVTYSASDKNGAVLTENAWVRNATFDLDITSGNGTAESGLASASYTMSGVNTEITIDGTKASAKNVEIAESKTLSGTSVVIKACDMAGNYLDGSVNGRTYTYLVDNTAPVIKRLEVNGSAVNTNALSGNPTITVSVADNLTLKQVKIDVIYPDGTTVKGINDTVGKDVSGAETNYTYTLEPISGTYAPDGDYTVVVYAYDKAGNAAEQATATFSIDNTNPFVNAIITKGTKGGKQTRTDGSDYYYRSDVSVLLEVIDENFDAANVTVTDVTGLAIGSSTPIDVTWSKSGDKYSGTVTVTEEGRHVISITAMDSIGNQSITKTVDFCIDKTKPVVNLTLNGLAYTESSGTVHLTTDAVITSEISDMTEDPDDFNIQIVQENTQQSDAEPSYIKTANKKFTFSENGDYTVNIYAKDMAGNASDVKTIKFSVDKAADAVDTGGSDTKEPGAVSTGETTTKEPGAVDTKDTNTTSTDTNKPGAASTGETNTNKPGAASTGDTNTNKPGAASTGETTTNRPGAVSTGDTNTKEPGAVSTGDTNTNKPGAVDTKDTNTTSVDTKEPGAASTGDTTTTSPDTKKPGAASTSDTTTTEAIGTSDTSTNQPGAASTGDINTTKPGAASTGDTNTTKPGAASTGDTNTTDTTRPSAIETSDTTTTGTTTTTPTTKETEVGVPSTRIVAPNAAISADDEKSPVTGDYDSRPAKKYGEEYLFSFTEDEHKLKWWLWIVAILAGLFKLIRKKVNK